MTELCHMQHLKDLMHTHRLVFAQTVEAARKLIGDGGWNVIAFKGQLESMDTNTLDLVLLAKEICPEATLIANDPIWSEQLMSAGCTVENLDCNYLHILVNRL